MRLEDADELAHRAVLADHWQEQGDPRGEVLALQVALAREDLPRDQSIAARRRLNGLLAAKPSGWMVEELVGHIDLLIRDHEELTARAPFLRRLALTGLSHWSEVEDAGVTDAAIDSMMAKIDTLLDLPSYAGITGLAFTSATARWMHDGAMSRYATNEYVDGYLFERLNEAGRTTKLRHLRLADIGVDDVRLLLSDPRCAGLRSLEISGITDIPLHWTPELVVSLGTRATKIRLRRFALEARDPQTLMRAIADDPFLADVDDLIMGRLFESPLLPRVRRLATMTGSPKPLFELPNLRELRLYGNMMNAEAARALIQSPLAKTLEVLDLRTEDLVKPIGRYLRERWDGVLLL